MLKEVRSSSLADKNRINEDRIERYINNMNENWRSNLSFIHAILCESKNRYSNKELKEDYNNYVDSHLHPGEILNYISEFQLKPDDRVPFMLDTLRRQSNRSSKELSELKLEKLFRCISLSPAILDEILSLELKAILNSNIPLEQKEHKIAKALGFNDYRSCSFMPYENLNKVFSAKIIANLFREIKKNTANMEAINSLLKEAAKEGFLFLEKVQKLLVAEINPKIQGLNMLKDYICELVKDKNHHLENAKNIVKDLSCPAVFRSSSAIGPELSAKDVMNALELYADTCEEGSPGYTDPRLYEESARSNFSNRLLSNIDKAIKDCSSFGLIQSHLMFYTKCAHTLAPSEVMNGIKKLKQSCDKDKNDRLSYCKTESYAWALQKLKALSEP